MNVNSIPKQYSIVGGVIIILIIAAVGFMMQNKAASQHTNEKESIFEEPVKEIPPVDASVTATLKGKTEGVITISGIPEGTDMIEYELIYDTDKGPEGAIGTMKVKGSTAEEKVTFGTCSSGVCRYHIITGTIQATFKFSGDYGEQLLKTEFEV